MVIAASSRTAVDLGTLVAEAAALPGKVVAYPLDVSDEHAVAVTVDAIETQLGEIDLAILNAGTHIPLLAKEFAVEPFRHLIATNLMGVVHGLAAILPRFIERRRGHVAVVASVAGYRGLPTAAAYGATKAALINLCEALKPELDGYGVRITLINPGFVKTPLTDRNPFKMPFLMEADAAAERIVRGFASGCFEISFPRRFTWPLKVLRCLPYPLAFAISRRLVPQ
jgi:NAD(P)-dependent dehydrogenase (short-subunit alcohol dehydrogenase family)